MTRAIALGLLTMRAIALVSNVQRTSAEEADLADDVQLLQMTMNEARSSLGKFLIGETRVEKVESNETQVEEDELAHTTTTFDKYNVGDFANISAVQLNAAGDLPVFLAGLEFNIELLVVFFVAFVVLLRCFPNMMAFRATGAYLEGEAKRKAQSAPFTWDWNERIYFGWIWYAFAPTPEQLIESSGLDAAMLLSFTDMSLVILTGIGLPFLLIFCPIYALCGGNAAGDDRLSHLGIGNVEAGSWIFWPVAISSWYVVIFTQRKLYNWMRYFIDKRETFLLTLPTPQCTTVLVEGIPDEYCSDAALKAYFTEMYGKVVKSAYVAKKISRLEGKIQEFVYTDRKLKETQYWIKNNPGKPKPHFRMMHGAQDYDVYYQSELDRLTQEIKAEQEQANMEARKSPEESTIYATNGFVTFNERAEVQQVMGTRLRIADDELVVSYPPEPADIIWSDLEETIAGRFFFHLVGYGCIVGLFLLFMPIVVAISQAANLDHLEQEIPPLKTFTDALGSFRDTLASSLASIGLTLMMSFLPTILVLIFNSFFTLIASRWAQIYIQSYYFWFLILFVLLVTAVGSSVTDFMEEIAESPFIIFSVLAQTMPLTTHFYLNYVGTQWVTHGMNLTRYMNLIKYVLFKRMMKAEDARAMAEPEDQDYYGMGSRSARFAFMLVLGLVFSSICPLLCLMVWLNFALCKLIYGYLIPYAESKKKDLGGDHFALQLIHVHLGLLIYIILMTGIMLERASTIGPGVISALSFLWWIVSFIKFRTKLHWENLCYEDVVERSGKVKMRIMETEAQYKQEALDAGILDKITKDPFELK